MLSDPKWEQKQLFDLKTPSLRALSHILRNRDLWPKDFIWNFSECTQCAMGLASTLWSETVQSPFTCHMAKAFGMNSNTAKAIFCGMHPENNSPTYGVEWDSPLITPERVADEIDKYLDGRDITKGG